MASSRFRSFFLPQLNRGFLLRLCLVTLVTGVVATQVLIPLRIEGKNMEPTYREGGLALCWRGRYLLAEPARGEVVAIRLAGQRVVLLMRIIGVAGDTVEFRHGALFVNGDWVREPYVRSPSDWNLAPRRVEPGKVYVAGDNRLASLDRHQIGQVERERILGGALW